MALRKDALGRQVALALVHADGHVGGMANTGTVEDDLVGYAAILRLAGIGGWDVAYLPVEDAAARLMAGMCGNCAIVFPCGCSWARVSGGQCQHGTARQVHQLGHLVGHCGNDHPRHVGPPLTDYQRVYRTGHRVAHLAAMETAPRIACSHGPDHTYYDETWRGTGSQREHEVAARLPLCPQCVRAVAPPGRPHSGPPGMGSA